MKPDYEAREDEELDKLLAKMLDGRFVGEFNILRFPNTGEKINLVRDWHPTKSAEQIQKYIYPKLWELGCQINIRHDPTDGYVQIDFQEDRIFMESTPKDMNKTIVICCLFAWDSTKEAQNDNK